MTCTAYHVRRGVHGQAIEVVHCLSHDGPFHVGAASIGRYSWRPEDDPVERARRYLAGSPYFPDVDDSNAADVIARNVEGDYVPLTCQAEGCRNKYAAKGYCQVHYQRDRRASR